MFRKLCSSVCIASLLCAVCLCPAQASDAPTDLSAASYILMVAETGEVLLEHAAHEKRPMASTTKVMTALVALESGIEPVDFTVQPHMVQVEGTSMGLLPGDTVSFDALLAGMLLPSGNDAAQVMAYAVCGNLPDFVQKMNEKAKALGMRDTHFETVTGLDAPGHVSTAYDMALLARAAVQNPRLLSVCSQKSMRLSYGNPPYPRTLTNHNRLLSQVDGAIGIKTGFTKKSGRCLLSAVRRNGVTLLAVTLRAPNDWQDHKALFDYGFAQVQKTTVSLPQAAYTRPVVGGQSSTVSVAPAAPLCVPTTASTAPIRAEVYLPHFIYAPVEVGRVLGYAALYAGDLCISTVPILAQETVPIRQTVPEFDKSRNRSIYGRATSKIAKIYGGKRHCVPTQIRRTHCRR